jgi:ABC-type oligopeptide transport system ATPase subunit
LSQEPIIQTISLEKHFVERRSAGDLFHRRRRLLKAVDGVAIRINKGESVGVVGESGCGKSTLGRTILRLYEPDNGQVIFKGQDISHIKGKELRRFRKEMQLVLQNPYSSLNPRKTVRSILIDAMSYHGIQDAAVRIRDLVALVGFKLEHLDRYPHELSGGERQRVAIARAISIEPDFVVLDEVTSSLDVSVQAQIINLLVDLKEKFELSYLFISHDLAVVKHICDRIAVMYLGRIVEEALVDSFFKKTLHPYSKALVSSIPSPEVEVQWNPTLLPGEPRAPLRYLMVADFIRDVHMLSIDATRTTPHL